MAEMPEVKVVIAARPNLASMGKDRRAPMRSPHRRLPLHSLMQKAILTR
jgi:hypothetical protein